MSARSTVREVATKAVILFGALFLVSVLLAAMPTHRAPEARVPDAQASASSASADSRQGQPAGPEQPPRKHNRTDPKNR
ncbi:MAG TPA: hypothetical protein VK525_15105 [Candidatus Saccharimonadales bacterium]|nr:hypothetical protein [Candidatus Saccharimonadales bacterium]